jgi:NAD(P)-dependent dehydrogenase (short-subunit alcohol dehydrogenase family)
MEHGQRLKGRVALITGAGRGIGRAIAEGYAREGAAVVLAARSRGQIEEVARTIQRQGGAAAAVAADVTDERQVEAASRAALDRFGQIDILVNCAGINVVRPTEEVPLEEWNAIIGTNLTGTFLCSRIIGRQMLSQGRGAIINIGSILSFIAFPNRFAYAATKGGVVQMTKVLAVEWAARGVRVNAIAPGFIRTELVEEIGRQGKLDLAKIPARTPMRRMGEVGDLVGPAIFLASDDAAFVTGHTLVVDGGWTAYGYF